MLFVAIPYINVAPITDAGGLCSSLNFSPLLWLGVVPYLNTLDLYLNGAAIFIIPLVA